MPQFGLIGRERELAGLDAAIERARPGQCIVLELTGEPGMGKTSLLRAFADRAASRSMGVLTSRASRFEQSRAYALFADPIVRADELVYAHSDIASGSGVLERSAPFDGSGAVADLIAASSGEHGMLLCLDDLHWADGSSLGLLRSLLRDPPDVPLVVACAFRPRQAPALLVACLADIADRCATERLDLAPLDREASDVLLGPDVEPPRRAALHQMSGGNPLYLRILAALPAGPGSDLVARAAWSALLGELAAVEPAHLETLRAAALLGDPFDATLLPSTAGLPGDAAFAALDELVAADLVRPRLGEPSQFHFRHALVRGLVLLQTSMSWRIAAHRRAAEALRAAGSGVVERAPHLAVSARPGDLTAVRELLAAAERVASSEPATAVAWLRAASRLLAGEAESESGRALRCDALGALLRVLLMTGQWEQCRAMSAELLEALGADHGSRRVAAVAFHALLERTRGDLPRARAMLEAELAAMSRSSTSAGAADPLRLGLARVLLAQRRIVDSRTALDGYSGSRFGSASTLALAAAYAGETSELRGHLESAVAALDVLTDAALAANLDSLAHLAWAEALGERGESAQRHFARGLRLGRRAGSRLLTPYLLLGHGYSAIATGRLRDAVRSAETAAGGESGHADLSGFALALLAWATVFLDGPEAAAAAAERAVRETAGHGRLHAGAVGILALVRFGQGRPAECVELVRSIAGRDTDEGPLRCVAPMLHSLASMASSALGDTAEAAAWAERALDAGAALGLPGQQGYALLASAVGTSDPRAAARMLRDAAERFAGGGLVLIECQARLLLAQKLVTLRSLDDASAEAGRAKVIAEACGAHYLSRRAADVQRRIGAARSRRTEPGAAAASARETQIIQLVRLGMSNQEVAAELFLSARTVEAHLTQIFRRFGVRSRAALIARAAADAAAEGRGRRPPEARGIGLM